MPATVNHSRFHFFLNNAGYATPPGRAVCAMALARAEAELERRIANEASHEPQRPQDTARVRWQIDEESSHDECGERWMCAIQIGCECCGRWRTVASLGGIELSADWVEADAYRKVVEAELALEAFNA